MTTVVDASAYLDLLLDVVPPQGRVHFVGDLAVPDLFHVEVANGLARCERRGLVDPVRASVMLAETMTAPLQVVPCGRLVERAFELRPNVSTYDGCYVALAEQLGCGILTSDARLARVPGIPVPVTLV
jgi:predicted nucleic acid-binding protein